MSTKNEVKVLSFIKRSKLKQNGEAPVFVRITYKKERTEFGIKKSIDPKLWNDKKERAKGQSKNAEKINEILDKYEHKIHLLKEVLEDEGVLVTANAIKEKLIGKKENRRTVVNVFRQHNEDLSKLVGNGIAADTVQRYETTLMHFKKFIKGKYNREDMAFSELTPNVMKQFEIYFKTERNCSHNTTIKYLKNFKKIVLIAKENGWVSKDPFAGIKFKLTPVETIYLTEKELDAIRYKKLSIKRLETVRDIFLFGCYTGLAFSDIKTLRKEHITTDEDGITWIHKPRKKTNQMSTIFLLDFPKQLIAKYENHPEVQTSDKVLPVPSNQKMNAYLKELADICGINKPISTHTARHTFATTVTLANNIPLEVVSKMLGHSNTKMTQRYAKTTENLIKKNMMNIAARI